MKKLILSFLLVCLSVSAFSQALLYASAASGSFTTGSATATTRTDDDIIVTSTTQNGYAVFDLSSIPAGSDITLAVLTFYVSAFSPGVAGVCNTYGFAGDLSAVTVPGTLFSDITSGTLLFSATAPAMGSYGSSVGYDSAYSTTASDPINTFIQANIGSKISICFSGGGTNVYTISGETAVSYQVPYLRVVYTPPCSGTPAAGYLAANVLDACSTTTVTLTETYASYGAGTSYQWQSSPDSATWTDISGATTIGYTFTGLGATTYFRRQNTCSFSGLSSVSAGQKINYITTCCSGTPPVGIATPSTTYCSSCSLTLTLSGYPLSAGISYQWEISSDNATWNPMWGADSTSHTFSPFGAYYYRCKTSCWYSGLSSYSSSVFVDYQYKIIADSVTEPSPSSCSPPVLFTRANGSPMLGLKTFYGDGAVDSMSMISDTSYSWLNSSHAYTSSGVYSIKQVLYYADIPRDSVSYFYNYHHCYLFPLFLYIDENANCLKDPTEPFVRIPVNVRIDSSGIPIDTVSATSGFYYQERGPAGTIYSFTMQSPALYVTCPSSGTLYDTAGIIGDKFIGVNCASASTAFDLGVYTVNEFTRGEHQISDIYAFNSYCTPVDAVLTMYFSPKYAYYPGAVTPAPSSVAGNSMTWNLYGLSSASPVHIRYLVEHSAGYLSEGDTVHSMYTITPITGDSDPSNNTEMVIDTCSSSWDPNEIAVTPSGCISSDTDGTVLQYAIHFTNVGSDTAFNIYVMDTLSDNVDPKSLQILMASNVMNVTVFDNGTHNVAKFDFPHIDLLDSTACPTCSGSVIFNIKTKQGLPDGATIFNRAGIYFDYNPVVTTNTVEDVKAGCFPNAVNGIKQESDFVRMLPNPATDELNIQLGNLSTYQLMNITNSIGQQIIQQPLTQSKTKVDISMLPAGMYYVTFRGDSGTEVRKFVKL